ncbi:MAG TPA: hypothetical protein VEZ70_11925 [Allosphingosinicella sp.]|jgi:hypothetical protein|nr:hypothetical protein [Allosphingosinicella sp.]
MKQIIVLAALLSAAGCAASADNEARLRADSDARLATELRNYSQAGAPVSCVSLRNLGGNRSAGEGAIIFGGNGSRVYVNRPPAGCPALDSGRALQVRTSASQLCRGEIVTVFDPVSGNQSGSCGLGDFTPYERRRAEG